MPSSRATGRTPARLLLARNAGASGRRNGCCADAQNGKHKGNLWRAEDGVGPNTARHNVRMPRSDLPPVFERRAAIGFPRHFEYAWRGPAHPLNAKPRSGADLIVEILCELARSSSRMVPLIGGELLVIPLEARRHLERRQLHTRRAVRLRQPREERFLSCESDPAIRPQFVLGLALTF